MNINIIESRVSFVIVLIVAVSFWLFPSSDFIHLLQGEHFAVTVTPTFTNYTQYQAIHIQNTKSEEVKHVIIRFSTFGSLEKISNTCIGGKFESEQYVSDITVLFEKIDPSYQCDIVFKTDPNTMMADVTITADNLPKYVWDTISPTQDLFYHAVILALIAGGAVIGLIIFNQRRNLDYVIKLPFSVSNDIEKIFHEKYGSENTNEDTRIIRAIEQGHTWSSDISDVTSIPKDVVHDKLKIMEKKGLFKLEKSW